MTKSTLDKTLTSVTDLSQHASTLGELAGADKVTQKVEKVQQSLSKVEKIKSLGEESIKRVQPLQSMGRQSGISPQGIVESGRGLSSPSMQNLSSSSVPNLSSSTLPTSDIPNSLSDGLSSISSFLNKKPKRFTIYLTSRQFTTQIPSKLSVLNIEKLTVRHLKSTYY